MMKSTEDHKHSQIDTNMDTYEGIYMEMIKLKFDLHFLDSNLRGNYYLDRM